MFWLSVMCCVILFLLGSGRAMAEGDDPPAATDPPADPPSDPPPNPYEAATSAMTARYRSMIEAQGGKIDANGNVTWPMPEVTMPAPSFAAPTDGYPAEDPNAQVMRQLQAYEQANRQRMAPIQTKALLDAAIAADPQMARVRKAAEDFLKSMDPSLINEKAVQGALWMARGMQADVELAEAQKSAWEDGMKASPTRQARAAQVEGGGEKAPPPPPALKLTPEEEAYVASLERYGAKRDRILKALAEERALEKAG